MRKDRKYLRIALRKNYEPEYARTKRYMEHVMQKPMTDTAFAGLLIEHALRDFRKLIDVAIMEGRVPPETVDPN